MMEVFEVGFFCAMSLAVGLLMGYGALKQDNKTEYDRGFYKGVKLGIRIGKREAKKKWS